MLKTLRALKTIRFMPEPAMPVMASPSPGSSITAQPWLAACVQSRALPMLEAATVEPGSAVV
jgi:hypothetical protein